MLHFLIGLQDSTMEESFTKHLPFSLLVTNLENEVLKRDPQIILGFFDPDPMIFFLFQKKKQKMFKHFDGWFSGMCN